MATGVHVVVFADESDPEGFEFLQMMKELAQTLIDNEDLSIVWIDPDEFALVRDECFDHEDKCCNYVFNVSEVMVFHYKSYLCDENKFSIKV